jgi:hypothetical protein
VSRLVSYRFQSRFRCVAARRSRDAGPVVVVGTVGLVSFVGAVRAVGNVGRVGCVGTDTLVGRVGFVGTVGKVGIAAGAGGNSVLAVFLFLGITASSAIWVQRFRCLLFSPTFAIGSYRPEFSELSTGAALPGGHL